MIYFSVWFADNIGRIAKRYLWVIGKPYKCKCADLEPVERTASAMAFGKILWTVESQVFSFL